MEKRYYTEKELKLELSQIVNEVNTFLVERRPKIRVDIGSMALLFIVLQSLAEEDNSVELAALPIGEILYALKVTICLNPENN